jgi:hypothetical protein
MGEARWFVNSTPIPSGYPDGIGLVERLCFDKLSTNGKLDDSLSH